MKRNIGLALRNNNWDAVEALALFGSSDIENAVKDHGFGVEAIATPRYCMLCGEFIGFFPFPRKWHRQCLYAIRKHQRKVWVLGKFEIHRPQAFYRGENSPMHILTEAAVLDIRHNYRPMQQMGSLFFAEKYGVSTGSIYSARVGTTWRWLPDAHPVGEVLGHDRQKQKLRRLRRRLDRNSK